MTVDDRGRGRGDRLLRGLLVALGLKRFRRVIHEQQEDDRTEHDEHVDLDDDAIDRVGAETNSCD